MTKSTICKPIIEDISNISKFDESSFGFDMQPLAFSGEYSRYAWCDAVGVAATTFEVFEALQLPAASSSKK